jgi:hypothetical protein
MGLILAVRRQTTGARLRGLTALGAAEAGTATLGTCVPRRGAAAIRLAGATIWASGSRGLEQIENDLTYVSKPVRKSYMTTNNLFKEIETLSPVQLESVYSFVYLLKHPDYMAASLNEEESIEAFDNERDALDFANHYAGILLNETR